MSCNHPGDNCPCCPICVERFKTPKFLQCGHSFCLECLRGYLGNKQNLECPVCRQSIPLPINGIESLPTNFALQPSNSSREYQSVISRQAFSLSGKDAVHNKCRNHRERDIEFYCQDCQVGVCVRCILIEHKIHNYVDLECGDTRANVLKELSIQKENIDQKISTFHKTVAAVGKAAQFSDKFCSRIISIVKSHLTSNNKLFVQTKNESDKVIEQLKSGIKETNWNDEQVTTLSLLEEQSKLKRLEKLEMSDIKSPMACLVWEEQDSDNTGDILGHLRSGFLFIPTPNDFSFNIEDIDDIDVDYYSQDKIVVSDVTWSCCVKKYFDGNFGIFIHLPIDDNPELYYCDVKYELTLMNGRRKEDSLRRVGRLNKFLPVSIRIGWTDFITWIFLSNELNGFLDANNNFLVNLNITEIVKKITFHEKFSSENINFSLTKVNFGLKFP